MAVLEKIWEMLGLFFGGILRAFERFITALVGSSNAREMKRLNPRVAKINELEEKYKAMSDEELRNQTALFRERLAEGEKLDDLLVEAFAVCREGGRRFLGMRHYDVQMIGGMVLHSGAIAEMVTGEGKTLVATLPAYLNALEGRGVHVVTVNDYLARRDMEWMGPLYLGLGLTVGAIQSDMKTGDRQKAYACDITYGTNNEFGFDYLRDNMRPAARGDQRFPKQWQQSQGPLHFAIIDEVDNILVDEARTPLIISGPAHDNVRKYAEADRIARVLKRDVHFKVNEKDHSAHLTDEGVREAEHLAGVESFYTAGNMEWPHLIDNSLKAHYLYKRDVNYVVKEGRVVIVDEFTGRLMEGRQWSDGLHQAVEAKEGVKIKEETQTLATITLQNFFKLYKKICGMTGTAMTEATEFWKIYKLNVIGIPTNRAMKRIEHPDVIYRTEREKFIAVADEIEQLHKYDTLVFKDREEIGQIVKEDDETITFNPKDSGGKSGKKKEVYKKSEVREIERRGRPVLVGTVSIEKSERLSALLEKRGVEHEVLNAKHHKREAEIIAQAGRLGGVTIATNMAGRGTDIVLGGNAETLAWAKLQDKYPTRLDVPREEWDALVHEIEAREKMKEQGQLVKDLGGLHVIGTERHEARRIDLQLRGRCGRQGDPGSSRFFLSLEDDLMRIFAGEWVKKILDSLGMQEGEAIESRMVTRRIEAAQKKVEERNFEIRKNLLEYDEVMDEQRKRVYRYRQQILEGANCRELMLGMISEQVKSSLVRFLDRSYGVDTFAAWAGSQLGAPFEGRQFRGMDFTSANLFAKDEAERAAESNIFAKIEENLPSEEEPTEWNWESLARFANSQYGLNLRDRDLKKIGRDEVDDFLLNEAKKTIEKVDLSEGAVALEEDYGLRKAIEWVRNKFGIELTLDEVKKLEADALREIVIQRAAAAYDEKESEYPVMAAIYRYTIGTGANARLDRDGIVAWARERFGVALDHDDIKNKQREEIRDLLVNASRSHKKQATETRADVQRKLEAVFASAQKHGAAGEVTAGVAAGQTGALDSLASWLNETFNAGVKVDELSSLDRDQLEQKLTAIVDDYFHPEMRRMERTLLLEIVDSAWKDHLLTMDHLRSSVGLKGWAQLDPKVEYKREGMQLFETMWSSIGERTTDLVFRMEQLNEEFVSSTWVETSATHAEAATASQLAASESRGSEQQQAADANLGDVKIEPIRNRSTDVRRNDPCPCGSGKKYKNCCMRNQYV